MNAQESNQQLEEALLAILLEAREAGLPSVTRTALVKYLYLLDYATAQETRGKTWTLVRWRFLHFGPFDGVVLDSIDGLVATSAIDEQRSAGTDKDYFLYRLADWKQAKSLSDLGVSYHARSVVGNAIREFARDLNRLLQHIYNETEPMLKAAPGDALDFSGCVKLDFRAFKPLARKTLDPKKVQALKEMLASEYSARHASVESYPAPRYDTVFALGMAALNAQDGREDDLVSVKGAGRIDTEALRGQR